MCQVLLFSRGTWGGRRKGKGERERGREKEGERKVVSCQVLSDEWELSILPSLYRTFPVSHGVPGSFPHPRSDFPWLVRVWSRQGGQGERSMRREWAGIDIFLKQQFHYPHLYEYCHFLQGYKVPPFLHCIYSYACTVFYHFFPRVVRGKISHSLILCDWTGKVECIMKL